MEIDDSHSFDFPKQLSGKVVAIGDIHGQLKKLRNLWSKIQALPDFSELSFVFLGDYVDRGPQVSEAIDFLIELYDRLPRGRITFVAGNHDVACGHFLRLHEPPEGFHFSNTYRGYSNPEELWDEDSEIAHSMHLQGRRYGKIVRSKSGTFSKFSAEPTFRSYGAAPGDHAGLMEAMPSRHKAFLRDLPWVVHHPSYVFIHAGLSNNPTTCREQLAILESKDVTHSWVEPLSNRGYFEPPPTDVCPKTVVSGHIHMREVRIDHRRIWVDTTGGWKGPLSAVLLPSHEVISGGLA